MPNQIENKKTDAALEGPAKTPMQRKLDKLKNKPLQFVKDSTAYGNAQKGMDYTWAKFGSFALVLLASAVVVFYYGVVASPRYVSESQFVVKQASSSDVPMLGLAALGSVSPSMRDALILQKYIQSREMAMALDESVSLKAHYERSDWDSFSKLANNSTTEDYIEYFQDHISVNHDEMSDVLYVEVQTFDAQYSLTVARTLLQLSEKFINNLGAKMAQEQMAYAQKEVERSYNVLSENQTTLISFQDKFELYNPEQRSGALANAINGLEGEIITQQTELKSLLAFMRKDAPEVKAKQIRVNALTEQLAEEKNRLTNNDKQSLNKINVSFNEIKLNTELALDLYKSSLVSLESVRAEAYKKLKHLLVIERPALAQQDKYPARIYSILTWFICLILLYFIGRLLISIVKEHQE
ncbi:lipopolysaccharide biosynthesis protein [Oleispira antarctica]|uniref:Lipopolysaccharide biosynthesis protein n=1 Tax=Oleispira antarctica TaxID=188908 RepID=A0A1Y5HVF1_OLEAN|nr:lipopolysaccharide biosynthesis protein [Oleispira antarctica]